MRLSYWLVLEKDGDVSITTHEFQGEDAKERMKSVLEGLISQRLGEGYKVIGFSHAWGPAS